MMTNYTEEKVNGPIEAAAAAMTQVAEKLLEMRQGDMLVVAWEETGIFVASQESLFPTGKALGELCTEQKLEQVVAALVLQYGDGRGE